MDCGNSSCPPVGDGGKGCQIQLGKLWKIWQWRLERTGTSGGCTAIKSTFPNFHFLPGNSLEMTWNSWISPGPTWRLASLIRGDNLSPFFSPAEFLKVQSSPATEGQIVNPGWPEADFIFVLMPGQNISFLTRAFNRDISFKKICLWYVLTRGL